MAILADSGTTGPAVTGAAVVQAVPAEVRAIIDEAFKGPSLAQAYAAQEFEGLSPEQKNVVVDSALETIAKNTQLLEAKINGSNNAYYDRLTVSVARSGAPNAEDFFVKHASAGKGGDTGYALRQHFFRCRTSPPSTTQGITVGTLLHLARKLGADFGRCVAALPPEAWSTAELKVSFATIPHRRWLYGTYLIRGEITVLAAPGGAGKTAFANGVVIEIATGRELLGEKVWMSDNRKVLYLNGEDSSTEIKRRLWAFCQQHKLAEQDLVRLYVAGADDTLVQSLSLLCVSDKGASAVNEGGFNVLESALQSLCPDLLVLDPLVVFCNGGNMNDNSVMSSVMRKLKALAVKYECAILVVHHTRKGKSSDTAGESETVSGAAAIVNLARRAIMPVTMTEKEAKAYGGVLPSQRLQYFKLVDAKSNLAPLSADAPWYELVSEELPNAEPPIYPHGDRVQAVKRAHLTRSKTASSVGPQAIAIRFELMKLVDRGLTIDGEKAPYSPNSTGKNKMRAILDDAMAAVEQTTPDRKWPPADLRATAERELEALKDEGWVVVEKIEKGRFRRCHGLQTVWERTPWAKERERLREHGGPTVRTEEEEQELNRSDLKKVLDELREPNGSIGQ